MPQAIQNPALKTLVNDLSTKHEQNPRFKADATILSQLTTIIGEGNGQSGASVAKQLSNGNLLPAEKLAIARKGLTTADKSDIGAIVDNGRLGLDPVTTNFLKAIIGVEKLKDIDGTGATRRVNETGAAQTPATKAVNDMRQLIKDGSLQKYYDAAIGIGDASLKQKALDLFKSLPKINGAATADDLISLGIWSAKPKGVELLEKTARYLPGRQVKIITTVSPEYTNRSKFMTFDPNGVKAITHRATLAGEKGDNFLVKVDGKEEPLEVSKQHVYDLNQPHEFGVDKITNVFKTSDYNDGFMKAKVMEAALKMEDLVGQLDFTKMKTEGSGGLMSVFGRGAGSKKMVDVQRACLRVIHDVIDMKYPGPGVSSDPGRISTRDAGRSAIKGIGACQHQASTMLGVLNPFMKMLGFDVRYVYGNCYRSMHSVDDVKRMVNSTNPPDPHSWLEITYRPSMQTGIIDRTWGQADRDWNGSPMTMDKAYSKSGDRYPRNHDNWYHATVMKPREQDVNMSGEVSIETFERQFGTEGRSGRENHMRNWQ